MSYDMHIAEEMFNYTYNVAEMWYASEPEKGIRAIYGLTGKEAIPVLQNIRDYMENHWLEMISYEPSNGCGSADGAREFLNKLISASIRFPEQKWDGD